MPYFAVNVLIMLAGILAGDGGDLGREQSEERAILVGCPHRAVAAQEARAGAFFAAETARAVEQPGREPFEADRHFGKLAAQAGDDAIDHAAGDQCLADRRRWSTIAADA